MISTPLKNISQLVRKLVRCNSPFRCRLQRGLKGTCNDVKHVSAALCHWLLGLCVSSLPCRPIAELGCDHTVSPLSLGPAGLAGQVMNAHSFEATWNLLNSWGNLTQPVSPRRNTMGGLVAGMKVIGQVLLSRRTYHCPLVVYSQKEGLCGVETYPYFQRIEDKG